MKCYCLLRDKNLFLYSLMEGRLRQFEGFGGTIIIWTIFNLKELEKIVTPLIVIQLSCS